MYINNEQLQKRIIEIKKRIEALESFQKEVERVYPFGGEGEQLLDWFKKVNGI